VSGTWAENWLGDWAVLAVRSPCALPSPPSYPTSSRKWTATTRGSAWHVASDVADGASASPTEDAHGSLTVAEGVIELGDGACRRAQGKRHAPVPTDLDLVSWTRRKLKPMVRGLFHAADHEAVLSLLERSVVFLTADNIEAVLGGQMWLHSAWDLANLFLSSVEAEMLGPKALSLLGLSQETTCYVSADYFAERGRFNDYVIHEAAHVFHNCKRATAGLPETRTREWLLLLELRMRETFAYSCEAYGWMVEHARNRQERLAMGQEFAKGASRFADEDLDAEELADIVREACEARNGWKVILQRCAPAKGTRRTPEALLPEPTRSA
jgi:hypothetical protein